MRPALLALAGISGVAAACWTAAPAAAAPAGAHAVPVRAGAHTVPVHANEGGGAIFFVSNDRTGTMSITDSTLEENPNDAFHTPGLAGIFFLGARRPTITGSILR